MKAGHILNRHTDFAIICLTNHEKGKPFHPELHKYFKANKQFGGRDRRTIKNLCYDWFRLGFSFKSLSTREQVLLAYLVIETTIEDWMLLLFEPSVLPPSWLTWTIEERFDFLTKTMDWSRDKVFPSIEKISKEVSKNDFIGHQFKQPKVWFRCKNRDETDDVFNKLSDAIATNIGAIGIDGGHQLTANGVANRVEIQDFSSQKVYGDLNLDGVRTVWDCCCASGGKSLALLDRAKPVQIYGSDSRKSILSNFIKRTGRHRFRVWSAVIDLSHVVSKLKFSSKQNEVEINSPSFDLIIADLPCSGSGTWNRNPEFKHAFNHEVDKYCKLQNQIVKHAWEFLKPGGRLLYTTCSVYEVENEALIAALELANMEVVNTGYVHGYDHESDTMFYAELKKI
ncbi:MAG: 16S rRNA (cytosine967-C5)-methyltransferase [Bacteroidia bacterium]|jgi:16S rRNA (cytosine967-C5)-methyltransferase